MKTSEAFPSKYISSSDIEGDTPAVISHIESEEFSENGRKVMKPILRFRGFDKGIVLNKTNASNIEAAYGDEMDDWAGKAVILFTAWVDFQGKSTEAIRVRPAKGVSNRAPTGEPQMTNAPPRGAGSSTPPQFSDPADPGYDPDDIR